MNEHVTSIADKIERLANGKCDLFNVGESGKPAVWVVSRDGNEVARGPVLRDVLDEAIKKAFGG